MARSRPPTPVDVARRAQRQAWQKFIDSSSTPGLFSRGRLARSLARKHAREAEIASGIPEFEARVKAFARREADYNRTIARNLRNARKADTATIRRLQAENSRLRRERDQLRRSNKSLTKRLDKATAKLTASLRGSKAKAPKTARARRRLVERVLPPPPPVAPAAPFISAAEQAELLAYSRMFDQPDLFLTSPLEDQLASLREANRRRPEFLDAGQPKEGLGYDYSGFPEDTIPHYHSDWGY